jgi:hypothetical protein
MCFRSIQMQTGSPCYGDSALNFTRTKAPFIECTGTVIPVIPVIPRRNEGRTKVSQTNEFGHAPLFTAMCRCYRVKIQF